MASNNWGFSQTHIDNLAKGALNTSEEKKSDNFIMGREVDNANNRDVSAVPQIKKEGEKGWERTYTNPQYTPSGEARSSK